MKSKKLKKIARSILEEMNRPKEEHRLYHYDADYDEGVSDRLKKMVLNLIKYNDNISINVDENRLSISANDIGKVKSLSSNSSLVKYSEDSSLEICITKAGFDINYGYRKRASYKDSSIFEELAPIVRNRLKEINFENFNDIWTDIMKASGVMRDSNLEELGL